MSSRQPDLGCWTGQCTTCPGTGHGASPLLSPTAESHPSLAPLAPWRAQQALRSPLILQHVPGTMSKSVCVRTFPGMEQPGGSPTAPCPSGRRLWQESPRISSPSRGHSTAAPEPWDTPQPVTQPFGKRFNQQTDRSAAGPSWSSPAALLGRQSLVSFFSDGQADALPTGQGDPWLVALQHGRSHLTSENLDRGRALPHSGGKQQKPYPAHAGPPTQSSCPGHIMT